MGRARTRVLAPHFAAAKRTATPVKVREWVVYTRSAVASRAKIALTHGAHRPNDLPDLRLRPWRRVLDPPPVDIDPGRNHPPRLVHLLPVRLPVAALRPGVTDPAPAREPVSHSRVVGETVNGFRFPALPTDLFGFLYFPHSFSRKPDAGVTARASKKDGSSAVAPLRRAVRCRLDSGPRRRRRSRSYSWVHSAHRPGVSPRRWQPGHRYLNGLISGEGLGMHGRPVEGEPGFSAGRWGDEGHPLTSPFPFCCERGRPPGTIALSLRGVPASDLPRGSAPRAGLSSPAARPGVMRENFRPGRARWNARCSTPSSLTGPPRGRRSLKTASAGAVSNCRKVA
jgi:hypothetical protein